MKPVFAAFLFITIMLVAFGGVFGIIYFFSTHNPTYEYLGELPSAMIEKDKIGDYVFIQLENSVGSISLTTDSSLDSAFQGHIQVWGLGDATLSNANRFETSTIDNYTTITFSSSWYDSATNPYTYELELLISEALNLELSIVTSTGDLYIDLWNETLEMFKISTSTGSQYISMDNIIIGGGANPSLLCSVGEINLDLTNISYLLPSNTWTIDSSTGAVNVEIVQTNLDINISTTRTFDIDTSLGDITVDIFLSEDYSCRAVVDTSLGSVNLPGNGEEYTSANYGSVIWVFQFNLDTSIGDIYFHHES